MESCHEMAPKHSQHTWSSWSGCLIIFWLNRLADYPVNFQDIHPLTQLILQLCQTLLRGNFLSGQPLHLMLILFLFAFQGLQRKAKCETRRRWIQREKEGEGLFLLGQMKPSTETELWKRKSHLVNFTRPCQWQEILPFLAHPDKEEAELQNFYITLARM